MIRLDSKILFAKKINGVGSKMEKLNEKMKELLFSKEFLGTTLKIEEIGDFKAFLDRIEKKELFK